jgi:hypothetical protein
MKADVTGESIISDRCTSMGVAINGAGNPPPVDLDNDRSALPAPTTPVYFSQYGHVFLRQGFYIGVIVTVIAANPKLGSCFDICQHRHGKVGEKLIYLGPWYKFHPRLLVSVSRYRQFLARLDQARILDIVHSG